MEGWGEEMERHGKKERERRSKKIEKQKKREMTAGGDRGKEQ